MTTALMPLDPSASPQQASRVLTIRANLLPQEIIDSRRARLTRTFVLLAVFVVLLLNGFWYWHVSVQASDAEEEFNQIAKQVAAVNNQRNTYQELNSTKNKNKVYAQQLKTLTADDLSWQNLLDLIRDTGTAAEVTVEQISGGLLDATSTATSSDQVGSLTITGSAPDKKSVADYVNKLASLTYVADPFVTNVTQQEDEDGVTFSLTASITDKALCGRYNGTTCKSGGK
ncbi:PilN domain-containing protein [Actinoplanes sp. NPDC051851]|uniref:PilN domain-containing protein n=1 Tax=Actinoplanes sp. NPDC051851 TaxID=3154753 RepID=UPI00344AFFCB